jgi:hypothetical protein
MDLDERHKVWHDVVLYWKARESLYEALRGCQGTSYARSREGYQWTIGSVQQISTKRIHTKALGSFAAKDDTQADIMLRTEALYCGPRSLGSQLLVPISIVIKPAFLSTRITGIRARLANQSII